MPPEEWKEPRKTKNRRKSRSSYERRIPTRAARTRTSWKVDDGSDCLWTTRWYNEKSDVAWARRWSETRVVSLWVVGGVGVGGRGSTPECKTVSRTGREELKYNSLLRLRRRYRPTQWYMANNGRLGCWVRCRFLIDFGREFSRGCIFCMVNVKNDTWILGCNSKGLKSKQKYVYFKYFFTITKCSKFHKKKLF